jgi:predicted nucleic acid-binding protein
MPNRPAIYVDSCSLIDAVKHEIGTLPPNRQADGWYLKQMMTAHFAGDIILYTSILSTAECVGIEMGQSKVPSDIQERFRRLLTSGQYLRLLSPTPKTARTAQDLRWKHELVLGGPDAIHIASALESECVEFISTDDRLKKEKIKGAMKALKSAGLRMIRAAETRALPEHYLQTVMKLDGDHGKG